MVSDNASFSLLQSYTAFHPKTNRTFAIIVGTVALFFDTINKNNENVSLFD